MAQIILSIIFSPTLTTYPHPTQIIVKQIPDFIFYLTYFKLTIFLYFVYSLTHFFFVTYLCDCVYI